MTGLLLTLLVLSLGPEPPGNWRESWTQIDPEVYERVYLAKDNRRGLSPQRKGR